MADCIFILLGIVKKLLNKNLIREKKLSKKVSFEEFIDIVSSETLGQISQMTSEMRLVKTNWKRLNKNSSLDKITV